MSLYDLERIDRRHVPPPVPPSSKGLRTENPSPGQGSLGFDTKNACWLALLLVAGGILGGHMLLGSTFLPFSRVPSYQP